MGFKTARERVLACLEAGRVLHESRRSIDTRNLLVSGSVSLAEISQVIRRAKGLSYSSSPHHFDARIEVHTLKTTHRGSAWYIKWYFQDHDCVFISVHH